MCVGDGGEGGGQGSKQAQTQSLCFSSAINSLNLMPSFWPHETAYQLELLISTYIVIQPRLGFAKLTFAG